MNKIRYCLFLFLVIFIDKCYSQNKYSLGVFEQYGYVLPTNVFIRGDNTNARISKTKSLSLCFINQTNGLKPWHQLYNYPSYGLGLYVANFNEPNKLGSLYAIYGSLNSTLFSFKHFYFKHSFVFGIAYSPKYWGLNNLDNIAIGSPINFYIQEGVSLEYLFNKRYKISLGCDLVHFSNGATRKPNKGINNIVSQVGFIYNFYDDLNIIYQPKPVFKDKFNIITSLNGGYEFLFLENKKEIDVNKRYFHKYYGVYDFSIALLKNFNYKHALGLGFSLSYQDNNNTFFYFNADDKLVVEEGSLFGRFNLSSCLSYEYTINRFSISLEPGIYLIRKVILNDIFNQITTKYFQKVGLRYRFYNNYYLAIRLNAFNFYRAHYLQIGIGYRIHI